MGKRSQALNAPHVNPVSGYFGAGSVYAMLGAAFNTKLVHLRYKKLVQALYIYKMLQRRLMLLMSQMLCKPQMRAQSGNMWQMP